MMNNSLDSFESALELCANRQCRIALAVLMDRRQPIPLDDLATEIVERDPERSTSNLTDETFEAIRHSLYHADIPKLTEAGAVEYDRGETLIEPATQLESLEPYLSSILEADPDLEVATGT